MQSYFIWKGTDCRTKAVMTRRHAPMIRPEERVEHQQIPGRSGDLTETEGENIYNSYIQTVNISVKDGTRVKEVLRWLRGSGYVTFSGDPNKRQQARVIGAVTLEKVSRNMDHWAGQVQFHCQPLKELLTSSSVELTQAGTVTNNGDVAARPIILAYPSLGATTMTVTVGSNTLTITNVTGTVRIDCEAQEATNTDRTALYTQNTVGPFPVLAVGANSVSGTGWSRLEIDKQERYL